MFIPSASPAARVLVIQHDPDDALNELGGPLIDAGLRLVPWSTWVSAEPPSGPFDAIISLGASASAIDLGSEPWMAAEHAMLRRAVSAGTPILGICFGSQLLASAVGGRVRRSPVTEVGWTNVQATPAATNDALAGGFGPTYPAFHFHYDTFDLPEQVATADGLPVSVLGRTGELIEAYRIGDFAWGLQFHLEANPGVVTAWLGAFADEFESEGVDPDQLHADTTANWRRYREMAWGAANAFAALVLKRTAAQ